MPPARPGTTPQDACSPTSQTARSSGQSARLANTPAHPATPPATSDTAGSASPSNEASPSRGRSTSRPRTPINHPQRLQPRHHPTRRPRPLALGNVRTPNGHNPTTHGTQPKQQMHGPRTEAPPPHDKTTCKRLPFRKCHGIVPTLRGSRKTVPTLHGPTPPTDFWPQSRTAPRGRAARSRRGQGATPTQAGRPDISGGQIETRAGGNPRSAPTNGRPVSPTARLTQALSATGSPQHSQPSVWKSPDGSAPRNAR